MEKVKQVIVMRTHYPDGQGGERKVRLGKYIAQGAHSSCAFLTNKIRSKNIDLTDEEKIWIEDKFTKICVSVRNEEELMEVYTKAVEANLTVSLITDAGDTEFGGTATKTCLAIGPHFSSKIDPITGELKLL